ncbi:hypothetical protein MSBR3_3271 [Methanosarcina barkeri 3]|uniref:Uncharacterized protein n=1 Tax=Methanosarcina barkeri 3 TaxID=1434107 RepID=A0A0E3WYG8_METBA|nr:hypothetical protein MSBR3_3271 [Methanosarcina barkeri 3]
MSKNSKTSRSNSFHLGELDNFKWCTGYSEAGFQSFLSFFKLSEKAFELFFPFLFPFLSLLRKLFSCQAQIFFIFHFLALMIFFPVNSDKCTPFSIPGCTCRSQLDFIAYTFTDANF